jgi:hypothetical protein
MDTNPVIVLVTVSGNDVDGQDSQFVASKIV